MRRFLALMIVILFIPVIIHGLVIAEEISVYSREAVDEFCNIWNDYFKRNSYHLSTGYSFKEDNAILDDIFVTYSNANLKEVCGINSIPEDAVLFFIWKPEDDSYGFCIFSDNMKEDLEKVVIYTDDKVFENLDARSGHLDEDIWGVVLSADDIIYLYPLDRFTLQMTIDGKDERVEISRDKQDFVYDMMTFLVSAQLYSDQTYGNYRDSKYLPDDYQSISLSAPALPTKDISEVVEQRDYNLGEIVEFGYYEQDNNHNGSEPIEWIVTGTDGNRVNLISKKILDLQRYNIEKVDVTWAVCNLRKWLNDEFLHSAFSEDEITFLLQRDYEDTDGTRLRDYVYCLSPDEVVNIWPNQSDRVASVTDYVFALEDYTNAKREGQWWLRSDSEFNGMFRTAYDVYSTGEIGVDNFRNTTVGVRPCICVSATVINKVSNAGIPSNNGDQSGIIHDKEMNQVSEENNDKRVEDLRVLNSDGTYTYSVAESNIKIKIPIDWYYADRNIRDDDLFTQLLGLTADEVKEKLLGNLGFLFTYDEKHNLKMSIDAWEDSETDFRFLNDMGIMSAGAIFSDWFKEQGIEVKETTTIQRDYPYCKIVSLEDGYVYTYITRIDGIQYVIQADTGTLFPGTEEKMIDNIVLNISFDAGNESEPSFPPESGIGLSSCSMKKFGSEYSIRFAIACEADPKEYKTVTIEYFLSKDGVSAASDVMYKSIVFDPNDTGRNKYAYDSVPFDDEAQGLFARICEIELNNGNKIDFRNDNEFILYGG